MTRHRTGAAVLAAFLAVLLGIGLARFAYTPLVPALVNAGWFDATATAYLGAANLIGYLAGGLLSRPLAHRLRPATVLRAMMLVATASFFASTAPVNFAWFFLWRFLAGLAGGTIMTMAAPAVLPHVAPARRGIAGGIIFAGVGLGVALSGTVMPFLIQRGLPFAWLALGLGGLLATLLAWFAWPEGEPIPAADRSTSAPLSLPLRALFVEYALNAAGLVPHMVFLVDFVARGLGRGLAVGAGYWIVFGIGALIGPVAAGRLADKTGFAMAYRVALLLQTLAVALAALSHTSTALIVSSFVAGAFTPGVVPLVLGRVHELTGNDVTARHRAWRGATIAFALGQAAAAYGFSYVFGRTHNHEILFIAGAVLLLAALLVDLLARRASSR